MKKNAVLLLLGTCALAAAVGLGVSYFTLRPHGIQASLENYEQEDSREFVKAGSYLSMCEADGEAVTEAYAADDRADNPEPAEQASPLFIVASFDGYIVVHYASVGGEPRRDIMEMTTTPINALPPEEQARLARGIPIYTDEALTRILEDYGS